MVVHGLIYFAFYRQDMTKLPDYVSFKHFDGSPLRDLFPAASDDLLQLLGSLLTISPAKRCNCTQALKMNYFRYCSMG